MPRRVVASGMRFALPCVCLLLSGLLSAPPASGEPTRVRWALDNLHGAGIHPDTPESLALDVAANTLTPAGDGASWAGFAAGAMRHASGFSLAAGGHVFGASQAVLNATSDPMTLELRADDGFPLFRVTNGHVYRHHATGRLVFDDGDLFLTAELAAAAGVPKLEGLLAGTLTFDVPWPYPAPAEGRAPPPPGEPCSAGFGPAVDVALTDMRAISQLARDPGKRVALAVDAHLANLGLYDVRWYWAIAPHGSNGTNIGPHPFLSMAYYMESNGVFRMIGQSDVKHAWNSLNTGCPCIYGQVMYTGCTDVYGVGNNGNQFYFGPRHELSAHDASWTSLGSHFDGTPVDDFRNHGTAHDAFTHRLVVREADLSVSGATYYVEAWYLAALDTNLLNGIGYRASTQQLVGSTWAFSFVDSGFQNGSALNAWVNPTSSAPGSLNRTLDTGEGHLQVAVKTWALPDHTTRYEYAVMNLDFDRSVRSFTVPVAATATVGQIGFNDPDTNAANDWIGTRLADHVRWDAPSGNALRWGTLYNFRLEANAPPSPNLVQLESAEPAGAAPLLEQSLAPDSEMDRAVRIVELSVGADGGTTRWNSVRGGVYVLEAAAGPGPAAGWTNHSAPFTAEGVTISAPIPVPTDAETLRLRVRQDALPPVP